MFCDLTHDNKELNEELFEKNIFLGKFKKFTN